MFKKTFYYEINFRVTEVHEIVQSVSVCLFSSFPKGHILHHIVQ